MKIGINIKLDVTKLDKARFFKGDQGHYCDLTAFIDTEHAGKYGDNGTVSQATTKKERDSGLKMPICGNIKIFHKSGGGKGPVNGHDTSYQPPVNTRQPSTDFSDDIPF